MSQDEPQSLQIEDDTPRSVACRIAGIYMADMGRMSQNIAPMLASRSDQWCRGVAKAAQECRALMFPFFQQAHDANNAEWIETYGESFEASARAGKLPGVNLGGKARVNINPSGGPAKPLDE